ncbi:MAG: hypothetical protein ACYC61_17030 [Isosphaeraceae bacterium]
MKPSYWIEDRGDEELAVHKVVPDPAAIAISVLPSLYCLTFAAMLFSAPFTAAVPMSRLRVALAWSAGLGLVVAGPALGYLAYSRATFGTWLIGGRAIEFRPARGPQCRIEWKDIRRVRWSCGGFVLLGDEGRITIASRGLRPDDWHAVRSRVEHLLAGRFDLAARPMPLDFRLSRVLAATTPLAILTAILILAMPWLPLVAQVIAIPVYLTIVLGAIRFYWLQAERAYQRLNPTWRTPKSEMSDLEEWAT